jgi:hypothetical protein
VKDKDEDDENKGDDEKRSGDEKGDGYEKEKDHSIPSLRSRTTVSR